MGSNTIERKLDQRQVDQLEKDLLLDAVIDSERQADNGSGAHLTDEDFLSCIGDSWGKMPLSLRDHLHVCLECSREATRLREAMGLFDEAATFARIQRKNLGDSQVHNNALARSVESLAAGIARPLAKLFTVSLSPLFEMQAASAAHAVEDLRIVFPVTEAGDSIPGLVGVLMRRSSEYYAKIEADSDNLLRRFRDRHVRLTITERDGDLSVLEREIPVGVVVFIGTGLKKTYDLSAEVL